MTLEGALIHGKKVLEDAGVPDFKLDAWYLLEYVCKIDRSYYYLYAQEEIEEEIFHEYELLIKKRAERIPLQYIIGSQEFMGLDFKVNSSVLIPRQDTETLIEEALKVTEPGMEVLDLCTGSGCIIISLIKHAAHEIIGTASDISKQALLIAKENARNHQVELNLIRSDLFQNITERYDMIVSNPPYIPTEVIDGLMPEVKNFEPVEALDGKEDGLYYYHEILKNVKDYLKPNGYLFFEVGHDQGRKVAFQMEENRFRNVKVIKDLAGNDRVVYGNLPSVISDESNYR